MILGVAGTPGHMQATVRGRLRGWTSTDGSSFAGVRTAIAVRRWSTSNGGMGSGLAINRETGDWVSASGRPLEDDVSSPGSRPIAQVLLERLTAHGLGALARFDGAFAIAWFDARHHHLHLIRDRFGIEPLFYAEVGTQLVFGSRVRDLRALGILPGGLDGQGLVEFLLYGYVPGDSTLDRGVRRVPPGSHLTVNLDRHTLVRDRWYRLRFTGPCVRDEREIVPTFRSLLERAVLRRIEPTPTGVFLSGGMDSSSVLVLARPHLPGTVHTFSFRCGHASFDESVYARALSQALGTEHTEVEYGEAQALEKRDIVREMDVPFCDVGINVGTWLLGRAAAPHVRSVLTGDGGDEFWASHPVYAAQRVMRVYDRLPVPRLVRHLLHAAAGRVSDSDRKRDLRVVLKRLLPHVDLPPALGAFRWRAYYVRQDLEALLTPAAFSLVRDHDPYRSVLSAYEGYEGPDDGVSPHLYNDYATASSYYFSRLHLIRAFGVEARMPFYDRRLVEFGARLPARLKLEGIESRKRLFRLAMEGLLPDVINRRTEKLGHSVPLKNWMRQQGPLTRWIDSLLDEPSLVTRGLFRPDAVARLLAEHRRSRHNHSHRLWSMAVLEAWLQAHDDVGRVPDTSASSHAVGRSPSPGRDSALLPPFTR